NLTRLMRRSAPLRPSRTALAMTTFQNSVRLLRRNGPADTASGTYHFFSHDATVKLPHAARTIARPISRMGTWYDITSERRPQASWQFPSSEGGGYGYSQLGGTTGETCDLRAPS